MPYFQLYIKLLIHFRPAVLFDKINPLNWYRNTLRLWVDDQSILAKSNALEAGGATGTLTTYIATSDCILTGVDSSSKMIELAKINNNNIDFLVENILDLPFENDFFDVLIAASLINIVPNKSKAIDELFRTCKKGGTISILVPSADFNDKNLISLQASLGNSGFSVAALEA